MSDEQVRQAVADALEAADDSYDPDGREAGFYFTMADAAIAAVDAARAEDVQRAAWAIVEACRSSFNHSMVDYGDLYGSLDDDSQYMGLYIRPAVESLLRIVGADTEPMP